MSDHWPPQPPHEDPSQEELEAKRMHKSRLNPPAEANSPTDSETQEPLQDAAPTDPTVPASSESSPERPKPEGSPPKPYMLVGYGRSTPPTVAEQKAVEDPLGPQVELNFEEHAPIYEHHRIQVDPNQESWRIDVFLASRIRNLTRSRVKQAASVGFVRVNGEVVKVSYKVKPRDEVSIVLPYPQNADVMAEDIPLDIPHEDEDLLLVNKPVGLVVHPGTGNYRGTLVNALLHHFEQLKEQQAVNQLIQQDPQRPGLVHRIDKDTSGLLVVAKHEAAYNILSRQFFERTTHRNYFALVWGDVQQDEGAIVGHIGRSPTDRKRFTVYEDGSMGKHAVTHYQVLARFGVCTLVRCKLETGRTHQIRVHFKYLGHTLFGDRFYGGLRVLRGKPSKAYIRFMEDCLSTMPRQALHAKTLGFVHPRTGQYHYYNCRLPEDFTVVLKKLASFMKRDLPAWIIDQESHGWLQHPEEHPELLWQGPRQD